VSKTARQILEEALVLSDEERADLAAELLDSLEPSVPSQDRSDEAWIAEIERRARDAIAGAPGVPWTETRARAEGRTGRR
jgi:putative addiction module component (TIGR02574 family)